MEFTKTLLVTGGAGFIGSHVVRRLVINYPEYLILNIDKLTYAGNLNNLKDIENKHQQHMKIAPAKAGEEDWPGSG